MSRQPPRAPVPVVLLTGPSGAGKSRVARRSGLPVVNLDGFYKDAGDPTLPHCSGRREWDCAQSWLAAEALTALVALSWTRRACRPREAERAIRALSRPWPAPRTPA